MACVAGFVPFGSPIVSSQYDWQYFYQQYCPWGKCEYIHCVSNEKLSYCRRTASVQVYCISVKIVLTAAQL